MSDRDDDETWEPYQPSDTRENMHRSIIELRDRTESAEAQRDEAVALLRDLIGSLEFGASVDGTSALAPAQDLFLAILKNARAFLASFPQGGEA